MLLISKFKTGWELVLIFCKLRLRSQSQLTHLKKHFCLVVFGHTNVFSPFPKYFLPMKHEVSKHEDIKQHEGYAHFCQFCLF